MRFWRRRFFRWTAVAFAAAAFAPTAQAVIPREDGGAPAPRVQPIKATAEPRAYAASTSTDEFSLADAGVGALVVLSAVLLGGGSVLVAQNNRRSEPAGA
jgi:hypothetical protein